MISENLVTIWQLWCRRKYPTYVFLALCFNILLASTVLAATGEAFSRPQVYALGLLGIGTLCISIYLFVVMFEPERF